MTHRVMHAEEFFVTRPGSLPGSTACGRPFFKQHGALRPMGMSPTDDQVNCMACLACPEEASSASDDGTAHMKVKAV